VFGVLSRGRNEAAGFVGPPALLAPHAEGLGRGPCSGPGSTQPGVAAPVGGPARADSGLPLRPAALRIGVPFTTQRRARGLTPPLRWGQNRSIAPNLEAEFRASRKDFLLRAAVRPRTASDRPTPPVDARPGAGLSSGAGLPEGPKVLELMAMGSGCQRVRLIGAGGLGAQLACRRPCWPGGAWSASLLPGLPVVPIKADALPAGPAGPLPAGCCSGPHLLVPARTA